MRSTVTSYRRSSGVAQAFMVLSFITAGLLLSVQIGHGNRSTHNSVSTKSDALLTQDNPSAPPSIPVTSPQSPVFRNSESLNQSTALLLPRKIDVLGPEFDQATQISQALPLNQSPSRLRQSYDGVGWSARKILQFLPGFSVVQHIMQQSQTLQPRSVNLPDPMGKTIDANVNQSNSELDQIGNEALGQRNNISDQVTQNSQTLQQTMVQIQREQPETTKTHGTIAQEQFTIKLVVDLSDRQLILYENNTPTHYYPIAIGKLGWETPMGEFVVTDKDSNPLWQHPLTGELVEAGEKSPLGTRWIGFWTDGIHQIGFHGTNESQSIGQAISHGCIRLHNRDIESVYSKVDTGTPIRIQL